VQVIFTGEKMAAAIDKLGQKVAESCPNTVQGEDEHILAGSTSTIMPVNHPFFACLWRTISSNAHLVLSQRLCNRAS
jgi:hypothetical protein